MKKYPLKEIVKLFDNPDISGNTDVELDGIASLEKAGPSDLSFLGNKKYAHAVPFTKAGAVLLPRDYPGGLPKDSAIIRLDNPSAELAKIGAIIETYLWPKVKAGIHPAAHVEQSAKIDGSASIGPNSTICEWAEIGKNTVIHGNCYIGRYVKIGNDCVVMPNAVIMDYCELGDRVRLQPGAVIGSDGYGYELVDGSHVKIPQVGKVVIEDDVEIGANTCIDRARFDKTLIGKGTKIDNLVQIAHNVEVGKSCLLVSQVGISGSTHLGDCCVLGGQVGVAGHLKIGSGTMIGGQSGVNGDIEPKSYVRGTPPRPYMKAHKIEILIGHLPQLVERLKEVEKRLGMEKKTFVK